QYGTPLIVSTGRLVYYKGFEHLIAASRELDASVVIIGSGPLESRLRFLSRDLPHVHLLGQVPEDRLLALLAAADCFVLASTSHAEGFGIATLEAQALGVPAVVTDVGTATVEAIHPDVSGLVISPGSTAELVAACKALLEQDGTRAAMRTAAREHVQRHHSSAALGERLRQIYEAAAGGASVESTAVTRV
ncbi:MAG: glycosyltransferase family 4 protein, partial [Solirubrobacteraceae bacterium]